MTEPTTDATSDEPLPRFYVGWMDDPSFPVTGTTENARAQAAREDAVRERDEQKERDRLEDEEENRALRLRLAGHEPKSLGEVFEAAQRRTRFSDALWERNTPKPDDSRRAPSDLSDLRVEARLKDLRVAKERREAEEAGRLALEAARKRRDARHTARREASGSPSLAEWAAALVAKLGGRR